MRSKLVDEKARRLKGGHRTLSLHAGICPPLSKAAGMSANCVRKADAQYRNISAALVSRRVFARADASVFLDRSPLRLPRGNPPPTPGLFGLGVRCGAGVFKRHPVLGVRRRASAERPIRRAAPIGRRQRRGGRPQQRHPGLLRYRRSLRTRPLQRIERQQDHAPSSLSSSKDALKSLGWRFNANAPTAGLLQPKSSRHRGPGAVLPRPSTRPRWLRSSRNGYEPRAGISTYLQARHMLWPCWRWERDTNATQTRHAGKFGNAFK
jgi:hypothetical protein